MLFGRSLKSHFHCVRLFAGQRVTAEYINYRFKKIQFFFFLNSFKIKTVVQKCWVFLPGGEAGLIKESLQ